MTDTIVPREDIKMITAYFKDEGGNTLVIDAPTFAQAYQRAVDTGFYVFDYDFEEWDNDQN
jgi:hypothetical protein